VGRKSKGASQANELHVILANRRAANRADWARRHPDIAREERALRKRRVELISDWKHKNEGTHETHEHASQASPLPPGTFGSRASGTVARLCKTGVISAEQLGSAVEIAQVVERIRADVTVRTASLETRVDVTRIGDGGFYDAWGRCGARSPTPNGARRFRMRRRCSTCWPARAD
jgi:hypothetical protein